MNEQDREDARKEIAMERLIRLAGARPSPSPAGRDLARDAARAAWRETVADRVRRRRLAWLVPALAAAALLVIVMLPREQVRPTPAIDVAQLTAGSVAVEDSSGGDSRLAAASETFHAGQALRTSAGDVASLRLAGGGELRLNANTLIRLVDRRRFALDRGHIYLDSGHSGGSTLVVETIAGELTDVGTRFDVALDGEQVRIRVREGAIRLAGSGRQATAGVGQQLVASRGGAATTSTTALYGADWSWLARAAPFTIEGATLDGFLRWVEREGGRRVEFVDPAVRSALGTTRLHGSVAGVTTEEALDVVLPASGLSHTIDGDRILIRREDVRR
jgi:ferric-dicitrate binding protein FerR (iron transport regulator)